jgi:CheY-like chemotaxis protein
MQGEREHCIQAGMDDYLAKPFKRDQLQEVIARWTSGLPVPPSRPAAIPPAP